MAKHTYLCNEDCNHCEAIRNRQVSLALHVLRDVFGEIVTDIVNEVCPNLTCCADCHIDDFCHLCDDDGSKICEIDARADHLAGKWKRILRRRNKASRAARGKEAV